MSQTIRTRVFLTGVGGQGTLTATKILAQAALGEGLAVTAGEIHGMAQRGGVVESTVLVGGYRSPRIAHGEAHVLLGFEPLETLRALPYLAPGGLVISSSEAIATIGVSRGKESCPDLSAIEKAVRACAAQSYFIPAISLGKAAGAPQAANMVLLGALCAAERLPFGLARLAETIRARMNPKLHDINLKAIELGAKAVCDAKAA
ncbi:Pyruvate/ketoisovalerate oxidoreductase [Desulfovibrio sp. X2]|uniref:indolepyruvate oxidoreductase subunit beta n=1 Tax=Desulfovibrio sp. X2 TaxID=941449 RepID=UPI00035888BF|nr:indolepyruvate oxidoreductase subunit beta [Desulfovibrio sp. X2]EPR42790.1 Pyruvate/ketoisovalerate oxidoreductase [Desulfovibrio sp. X2]